MNITKAILGAVLGKRLPITSGELKVEGITAPVLIRRDTYGIPYIKAESERDAFFALGFCQGQDRAFQVERLVRIARGNLAELFGPPALSVDRLSLRVGLFRHAAAQLQLLEEPDRRLLEAFAAGINAGSGIGCKGAAPEFRLLGANPSEIQAADPLGILNFVALILSPWPYKINRLMVLRQYGPDTLQALDGAYPEWLPATVPVGASAGPSGKKIDAEITRLSNALGLGASGGSNSWAVNASRSATGRSLLASDPHLSPTIPSHWYLACLDTPDYRLRGATLAGTPFFSVGHNQYAAWGVTGGSADNTDLYLEELDLDNLQVRDGEGFRPLEVTEHTISIKGNEPIEERIMHTPRGPIISDVLDGVDLNLSIRASWMEPHPIQGLFEIYRVKSFQEFQTSWLRWYQATMNMVYADSEDNIGWQFIGDIPVRKISPVIPLPGWDPDFDWEAPCIPSQEMPSAENPPTGLIATANGRPTAGEEPYLGIDFADSYRLARIVEVMEKRQDWDPINMAALQEDQYAIPWREIKEVVLGITVERKDIKGALEILANWDGQVSADSTAASLYEYTLSELVKILAEELAPDCQEWVVGISTHPLLYSSLGKLQVSHLSRILRDYPQGILSASREELISRALSLAIAKLKEEFGENPRNWAWGQIRPLTLEHPLGEQPLIGKLFKRGPFPWGGDSQTVSQAQRSLKIPTYNPTGIANLRMVLEVGNWENNLFILAGGQSGNPFSPHYDDQLPLWQRGEGLTLSWGEESIQKTAVTSLRLEVPGGK